MARHFTKVCEFGETHGTCRCPASNKQIITIPCDRPGSHKPKPTSLSINDYPPIAIPAEKKSVDIRFSPEEAQELRAVLQSGNVADMSWDNRVILVHAIGVQLSRIGEDDS